MKVKELIEKLKEFDGNAEVGGSGHFGEILEIYDISLSTNDYCTLDEITNEYLPVPKYICITTQYAGCEPD